MQLMLFVAQGCYGDMERLLERMHLLINSHSKKNAYNLEKGH